MTPYYRDESCTLYCGDCRDVLPHIAKDVAEAVITDPVWPNSHVAIAGRDETTALLRFVAAWTARRARRLVVHVSVTTDPRWLGAVTRQLPFQRLVWLEYARPAYRGRHLSGDVAYAFGDCPKSRPGKHIISGRCMAKNGKDNRGVIGHPMPRKLEHVQWLIKWWAGSGVVLDPFAGSGTTLLAAKGAGLHAIGVEVEEAFCEIAAKRLSQGVLL